MIRKIQSRPSAEVPVDADAIKTVPPVAEVRERIRRRAAETAASLDRARPLKRPALEALARTILDGLELPPGYLGFAMVALSNEFWRPQFAAIPFRRRLLLLPHCLRNSTSAAAPTTPSDSTAPTAAPVPSQRSNARPRRWATA